MAEQLRLAIQKSGRLSEDSLKLIKECGIDVSSRGGKLRAVASNFPVEVLFLRDDDIPGYVADGVADLGIVGENVSEEKGAKTKIIDRLGFSKCRLSIGVPRSMEYSGKEDLDGMEIATSYPNLLTEFLKENGIAANVHEISGSVEIAPGIGLADAVCDIVSSGSTLISNGLKEAEVIFCSEAVLVSGLALNEGKQKLVDDLIFRIQAVKSARNTKYILLNAPSDSVEEIVNLLPGVKSPTVMPLAKEGWCSLHSVVKENQFWQVIEKLKGAGAEGILVLPIEKIIQ